MRGFAGHIVAVVLAVAAVLSCRGPQRIPRDTLAEIYCDMFLADQYIRSDAQLRRQADTLLVYEGIFQQYGYDTDDYLYSVDYYLRDPERFAKILNKVSENLSARASRLKIEISREEWREKLLSMPWMGVDSLLRPFSDSALFLGLAKVQRDTLSEAWFTLTAVRPDSLAWFPELPADSLTAPSDSLAASADTLEASVPAAAPVPQAPALRQPARPRVVGDKARPKLKAADQSLEDGVDRRAKEELQ